MLRFTTGDMFETPADIRVNTVNCVGVMGAGVALAFKTRYPDMFRDYKRACEAGEVQPGKLHVWKSLTGDWIINFPTKRHWRENSRYEDIAAGLVALRNYLSTQGKVTVALPALGCGHGGLDWGRVSKMISEHLDSSDAEIVVFEPADSRAAGEKVLADMLEAEGIRTVPLAAAGTARWPSDSGRETAYVRGNPDLLRQTCVAFASSPAPQDREREATTACMAALAREGMVFSLNYDGLLDAQALGNAIEKGSNFVIWVSEGLMDFRLPDRLHAYLRQGNLAIASVVNPRRRPRPGAFEETQAVKLKLGKVGIITEPRPNWIGANPDGFRRWLGAPLFYLKYRESDQDTRNLLRLVSAKPIGKDPKTGQPNVSPILEILAQWTRPAVLEGPGPSEVAAAVPTTPEAPVLQEAPTAYRAGATNTQGTVYPKRLIEVDLPIKRISAHARREKSIRHGHISTLHIWWARRPLAACRAVICAALWPDPADPNCPAAFRKAAAKLMLDFARKVTGDTKLANDHCSPENFKLWQKLPSTSPPGLQPLALRSALLDFIADFANWDNSTVKEYLDTSRALTQAAHEALGGAPGTRPLVVDPFAGGGSIPLEALRVGADAFASDLNPVAVLLNKVVLEYIPKYGQRLADEVRKWGEWIKKEAEKKLVEFYPKDPDGATPIAYLWARTIQCEGPGCGAEVPLIRSLWLAKKPNRSVALQIVPRPKVKRVDLQIVIKQRDGWVNQDDPKIKIEDPRFEGTVKRGSATCLCCGYTTPVVRVREQLKKRRGGACDARLMCIVAARTGEQGRLYRLPTDLDLRATRKASAELQKQQKAHIGDLSLVPDEKLDVRGIRHTWAMIYGLERWGDLFMPRQALMLATLFNLLDEVERKSKSGELSLPLRVSLALAIDRQANASTSLCRWHSSGEKLEGLFARQAIPMLWDFAESAPFCDSTGSFDGAVEWVARVCQANVLHTAAGQAEASSATSHPLADDSAHGFITDPPYYDAVPYAYLSDFFYVWLRRCLSRVLPELFAHASVPKDAEIVVDRPHELSNSRHDIAFYERELTKAFAEGRRVLRPDGVGTVVFASKTTASWEAILKAVVDAGWIITGSWPIDTEMEARVAAQGQARLASSIHLVCRPRQTADGSLGTDGVGDWRDVLTELPPRIHEWMPRLAEEGVVGADAIFACLGPALEIFSRYSRVEKASGQAVTLGEYLVQVWAAVAKEALTMIFTGADATGFEEDARLTAMWLWTLNTKAEGERLSAEGEPEEEPDDEGEEKSKGGRTKGGFALEYDAGRKIAQGLGAHLEDLESLVEISGETARLLPVAERANHLFGKGEGKAAPVRRKREPQMDLFKAVQQADGSPESTFGETKVDRIGKTVLDRIHQSMILFAAGRGEALKRFIVEDAAGNDARFWTLAQALSALYPASTEEKRWVDGVLARKKGLGF